MIQYLQSFQDAIKVECAKQIYSSEEYAYDIVSKRYFKNGYIRMCHISYYSEDYRSRYAVGPHIMNKFAIKSILVQPHGFDDGNTGVIIFKLPETPPVLYFYTPEKRPYFIWLYQQVFAVIKTKSCALVVHKILDFLLNPI